MKKTMKLTLAMLALGVSALAVHAQDANGAPGDNANGPRGHRPPPPAVIGALDANHDGVIDADEIANASAALKALDKNGDGKLTPDEFMGPRPHRKGSSAAGDDGQAGPPPNE